MMFGSVLAMLYESARRDSDTPSAIAIAAVRASPVARDRVVPTAIWTAGRARDCVARSNSPVGAVAPVAAGVLIGRRRVLSPAKVTPPDSAVGTTRLADLIPGAPDA